MIDTTVPPEIMKLLQTNTPYLFRPGSLLNVGANRVRFQLLDDLHRAGREITLLEAWPDNAAAYENDPRVSRIIAGDVRELGAFEQKFDAALWWHGPEHIDKADLPGALQRLEACADSLVVVGCPWGDYPQEPFMDNPYDEHKASIYTNDLVGLGYHVEIYDQMDKGGKLIAWKYLPGPKTPHVIMVTHKDRECYLERTIPALLQTTWPMTLAVGANAPGRFSLEFMNSLSSHICLVVSKKNLGKSKMDNRLWEIRPEADYVVVLDDDMLAVDRDWLRKLVDIVDCCPEVGSAGHSVEKNNYPLRVVGNPKRTVQVQPSNLGGCVLIPRRTFEQCGRYNEEMGLYGEEDALYGWKVRQAGMICAYFDHSDLGRSFKHLGNEMALSLGENDPPETPEYRQWKDAQREKAIPIRDKLIAEYKAGRPLNQ